MTYYGVPIGVAAMRSGVKVPTIRYYEQIGLLPKPPRTKSNRRNYNAADLRRLVFIRHARELGFSIEHVRELLSLADQQNRSCAGVDTIARQHLAELEQKIADLKAMRRELSTIIDQCGCGVIADCRIIEALSPVATKATRCKADVGSTAT